MLRLALFLPSFLPSTGDKSASGPGPRPPRCPLFGGTGLWGQRLGLQPEVGVAGGVRLLFIPRPLTLSRIPASSPGPLWHYPRSLSLSLACLLACLLAGRIGRGTWLPNPCAPARRPVSLSGCVGVRHV